jgi:putative oxidoreductase
MNRKQQHQSPQWMHAAARALMALIFIIAGVRKLLAFAGTADYFSHLGLPLPELATALTIALEIGGGLALLFGLYLPVVAAVLGVFTVATAVIGHPFWAAEPAQFNGQLNNFLKNVAMAGGFLLLALQARSEQ